MSYRHKKRALDEPENVHRWLVSYADYMTLMFALFVVLYAMAMVNEKPFESITESLGNVFQASNHEVKNRGHGDSILMVNNSKTDINLYGNDLLETEGPALVDKEKVLSNISDTKIGSNLKSLEKKLQSALFDLVESGFAKLEIDGDWLEIELNSGLLFPSGSSSTTRSAETILTAVYEIIEKENNFIRIRGYTDNQSINNEIYSSNWELSVSRATAVLIFLEKAGINPARMAIEGYGQYYPSADNLTREGRAKNRRVVVAISKYGIEKQDNLQKLIMTTQNKSDIKNVKVPAENKTQEPESIKVIKLKSGGIRITTRDHDISQE